jgi:hypothetical protein
LTKIFKAICKKTRKTEPNIRDRAIYTRIETFQRKHDILTTTLAQNAYAYDAMGINVQKLGLSEEEKEELQKWLDNKAKPVVQEFKQARKETKIRKIRKEVVDEFSLPSTLANDANRMANIYQDLYKLENLVRYVIMSVLEERYKTDWWENRRVVSKTIADNVEERKHFEKKNRWVAKRGTHNIFYTTFGELARIINLNTNEFKKIFADMEIEAELRKLEPLRNIIAHNNPLPPIEIGRIRTALADLEKQLKDYDDKRDST